MDAQKIVGDHLAKHGDRAVNRREFMTLMTEFSRMVGEEMKPLRRRIEALETEVRAGHERIKELENGNGS